MGTFIDFVERKEREHQRALARHVERSSPITWRMKLRVRMLSKLNTEALELKTWFLGRRVIIRSRARGRPLKESEWIVFIARRFKSIDAAAEFGIALQTAVSAIAALRHIPIDVGADNSATSSTSEVIKEAMAKDGKWLIDDVHGVDVYPDTQTAMVEFGDINVTTSMNPDRLTEPLERAGKQIGKLDDAGREASLLVNAAYMAPHPVAMLTLGIAAVEMLAPKARRSPAQRSWIAHARRDLLESEKLSDDEREGLLRAVSGLGHVSVLSRTRQLLARLGLDDLSESWVRLYQKRSRLFHGDRIVPFAELQAMGGEARQICHRVLTAYFSQATGGLNLN